MEHNNLLWSETLPTFGLVLFGIRTAMQEDSTYAITQMVFGQNISLPEEFFHESTTPTSPDNFAKQFQKVGTRTVLINIHKKYLFLKI